MSDLTGQTIGGYPVERKLAAGAFTERWQVQTSSQPLAARILKDEFRGDAELCAQIKRGWDLAHVVQHPNLAVMYSAGLDPQSGVFALEEIVPGKQLREMILGGAKIAWRDCIIITEQLLGGLQALHAAGHVHGCVWPGDIQVTQDQDVKLEAAGALNKVERPVIELFRGPASGYLAPETLSGSPPTIESDIYGVGAVIYFILAGSDPFPGDDPEQIREQALSRRPPPVSALRDDIAPEIESFIGRLMGKESTQRYGTAAAALADLANLKNNKPLNPLVGGRIPPPPRLTRASAAGIPAATSTSGAPGVGGASRSQAERRAVGHNPGGTPRIPAGNSSGGMRTPKPPGASTGTLAAIKGPTGKVFGRLDTHVKSTIPQSETERKGDEYYRQGQLPLALAQWKSAFESEAPHAALKIKIELGEKDLHREAYASALEDAKGHLALSEYRQAINRAREAIISAETDAQRQDAIRIEGEAARLADELARSTRIKSIIGIGIAILVIVIAFILIRPGSKPTEDEPESPDAVTNKTAASDDMFRIAAAGATVRRPPNWVNDNGVLRCTERNSGELLASMRVSKLPKNTDYTAKRDELREEAGKEPNVAQDYLEVFAILDDAYTCAKVSLLRPRDDGGKTLVVYFILKGPGDSVYIAEFEGPAELFDPGVQTQMHLLMQSWTFR